MTASNVLRMALVCGAAVVAAASGTSNSNTTATADPQYGSNSPPPDAPGPMLPTALTVAQSVEVKLTPRDAAGTVL